MSLATLLARQARLAPSRTAVLHGTVPWATWGQWAARSAGLATRLLDANGLYVLGYSSPVVPGVRPFKTAPQESQGTTIAGLDTVTTPDAPGRKAASPEGRFSWILVLPSTSKLSRRVSLMSATSRASASRRVRSGPSAARGP